MQLSVFDMFKIGIGPSSSHTMGPWWAALRFLNELSAQTLPAVSRMTVDLYGSLAKTGKGHGTDIALQLGLCGEDPVTMDTTQIQVQVQRIAETNNLPLLGTREISFHPDKDIRFHANEQLPFHPNALRFTAWSDGCQINDEVFYSIGGGFIVKEGETHELVNEPFPFPIECANDLLGYCQSGSVSISDIVLRNERTLRTQKQIDDEIAAIKNVMFDCIHRGCQAHGTLPGGLNVERRAGGMAKRLLGREVPTDQAQWIAAISSGQMDFQRVLDWVSCFALAVNEENAAFGRVVTAPTNGAAGVIPAVLLYAQCFCDLSDDMPVRFLATASEIGCIFKKGATISAALGGCQAEIGVSSAMAAAALCEALGGSPLQAAEAAEIAMEHHLGMTCDPIGGLVQIPCIERNAMGAIKAITAAQLSLQRDPSRARVTLDAVVRTMWQTAQDMNAKYKETSEGGLAIQIPVNVTEC